MFKDIIEKFAIEGGNEVAFSVYDGKEVREISYKTFADDVLRVAGFFVKKKLKKKHIAIIASNSYNWVVSFFSVIVSDNVAVLMNPALSHEILLKQNEMADISLNIVDNEELYDFFRASGCEVSRLNDIVEYGQISPVELVFKQQDETVVLMFTSGTTGKSKAVELTIRNLAVCVHTMCQMRMQETKGEASERERVYFGYPMFHIAGLKVMLRALYQTATICMGRGIRYMFADFKMLNPTHISLVPMSVESAIKIMKQTDKVSRREYFGDKLTRVSSGGAAMRNDVVNFLIEQGYTVETAYGMTETTGVGTWRVLDGTHVGSLGRIGGDTQCRIQDGEILFKTAGIMKGYYKDPEETSKIIEDGWIHTGDMGYCDEDGYYYITGRKKNVIILSNGENVNPEEIEATLGDCEAIEECLVYSDGKGICADVYTNDRDTTADFIRNYNNDMPMYRQIYKINYTEEPLEKTGSGKIKRKENK